jgi:hypothetical protein
VVRVPARDATTTELTYILVGSKYPNALIRKGTTESRGTGPCPVTLECNVWQAPLNALFTSREPTGRTSGTADSKSNLIKAIAYFYHTDLRRSSVHNYPHPRVPACLSPASGLPDSPLRKESVKKSGVRSQSIDSNGPILEPGMPVPKKTLAFSRFFLLARSKPALILSAFRCRPPTF